MAIGFEGTCLIQPGHEASSVQHLLIFENDLPLLAFDNFWLLNCVDVDSHVSLAPHEHEQPHKERQKDMYFYQKMRKKLIIKPFPCFN